MKLLHWWIHIEFLLAYDCQCTRGKAHCSYNLHNEKKHFETTNLSKNGTRSVFGVFNAPRCYEINNRLWRIEYFFLSLSRFPSAYETLALYFNCFDASTLFASSCMHICTLHTLILNVQKVGRRLLSQTYEFMTYYNRICNEMASFVRHLQHNAHSIRHYKSSPLIQVSWVHTAHSAHGCLAAVFCRCICHLKRAHHSISTLSL